MHTVNGRVIQEHQWRVNRNQLTAASVSSLVIDPFGLSASRRTGPANSGRRIRILVGLANAVASEDRERKSGGDQHGIRSETHPTEGRARVVGHDQRICERARKAVRQPELELTARRQSRGERDYRSVNRNLRGDCFPRLLWDRRWVDGIILNGDNPYRKIGLVGTAARVWSAANQGGFILKWLWHIK
jgi:hypothetical protein